MSHVTRGIGACSAGLLLLAALAAGCSKSRGAPFDPDVGHPDDFFPTHPAEYRANGDSCTQCHGVDLLGGIAKVSCSSASFDGRACHPGGPGGHPAGWRSTHTATDPAQAPVCAQCHDNPSNSLPPNCFNTSLCHGQRVNHPDGWASASQHGATAKRTPGASSGFASCTDCHGTDFGGGDSGVSCSPCHGTGAPHPPSPWLGRYSHTTTAPANAAECLTCHRGKRPPPGAAPGCFNATLCHAHEPAWAEANRHGAGAKDRPSATRGLPACQSCHGRLFEGGVSGGSCYRAGGCHTRPTPHPPAPWRGSRTHTTTWTTQGGGGNAAACALCHRRPSAPPTLPDNCFNNSLCHD